MNKLFFVIILSFLSLLIGLIKQLEFEGFDNSDATYAVENIGIDWREQAVKMAENYLEYTAFSRSGLIEQLKFEGVSD